MSRSSSPDCHKVWKVWKGYGRPQSAPVARFPYLPYLPHHPPPCVHTHPYTRARARAYTHDFSGMEGMEGMEKPQGIRLSNYQTLLNRFGRYGNHEPI